MRTYSDFNSLKGNGAGDRNRTGIYSLEGCRSTVELRPRLNAVRPHALSRQALLARDPHMYVTAFP